MSLAPQIGWQRLARLQAVFGGLDQAWQAPGDALAQRAGFRGRLLEQVGAYRLRWGADPFSQAAIALSSRLLVPLTPASITCHAE